MRKILMGVILGVVLAAPVAALADNYPFGSAAKTVGGIGCDTVIGNDGKPYPDDCSRNIYKFTDGSTTCYIISDTGISCLK